MRVLAALTVAAGVLAAASPAAADWQWTKWGMSPSEVMAASGARVAQTSQTVLTMAGPYEVGRYSFSSVEFVFKTDRLTFVVLNGDVSLFELVNSAVAQQYGQAVAVHDQGRERVYADRENGNTVKVRRWPTGGGMSVVYEPLESGF